MDRILRNPQVEFQEKLKIKKTNKMNLSHPPTMPDSHIVRTYPTDYAQSDTDSESEVSVQLQAEAGDEELQSIADRLELNRLFLDQQLPSWSLEPQTWLTTESSDVVLVRRPTASMMSHWLLNPCIYRNIQNVGGLDDLAALLDTPDDWEVRYNALLGHGSIIELLNLFSTLPDDTPESHIQSQLNTTISIIAHRLDIIIRTQSETKVIVGGILARYQYDIRSSTDPMFQNTSGMPLIATEVKTNRTFPPREVWHHGCRGIQILSALYAFNCPTFLVTQRQWKLFVENRERNAIFTFPYNNLSSMTPHNNSTLVHPMGTTFLKAVVICLLSQREPSIPLPTRPAVSDADLSKIVDTPQKDMIREKHFQTPAAPSVRQFDKSRSVGSNVPSFISGYIDGQPIYTTIRVVPADIVAIIEEEISQKDKEKVQKQSSDATLC